MERPASRPVVQFGQVYAVPSGGGDGEGETVGRAADPRLSAYIAGYIGYRVRPEGPTVCRLLPTGLVTVVVDFNAPSGLVSGLSGRSMLVEHAGSQYGMAVGLTPLGAFALFGVPQRELTERRFLLSELLGARADKLTDMLADLSGWDERFVLLEETLAAWMDTGPAPALTVSRAWSMLRTSRGRTPIGTMADELGLSWRQLQNRFAEQVGVPPKTMGRIIRFQHAMGALVLPRPPSLAAVAAGCGYADQAHLSREVREFTGCTPTDLLGVPAGADLFKTVEWNPA